VLAIVGTATLIALLGQHSFLGAFKSFILFLLAFFTPWSAINLVDYYCITRERYDVTALADPDGRYGRWNLLGISVYVFGVLVQLPFISTKFYTGPLVAALGDVDNWARILLSNSDHVLDALGDLQGALAALHHFLSEANEEGLRHWLAEGADIITTSTHKTFPGPQGGMIMGNVDEATQKKSSWRCFRNFLRTIICTGCRRCTGRCAKCRNTAKTTRRKS